MSESENILTESHADVHADDRRGFHRINEGAWVGGVCSGLAKKTQTSIWFWRGGFALTGLCWGLGLLGYLVFAIILKPDPRSDLPLKSFFTRTDWIALWLTTGCSLCGYLLTITPGLTLEDSGELAVASMYAGVPHPPGYPVWTLYTWLFTELLPFSNIAFRVAVSSAVAAALACGIIAMIVSRGSALIIEGVTWFEGLGETWRSRIGLVSGFVGGMLMAFNGFMWSQAVIVEVYTLSVLSLMLTLVLVMRWMYETENRKYLYWAFFVFGVSFTNHQTLIVSAMGIEVMILMAKRSLGRDLLATNGVVYVFGLVLMAMGHVSQVKGNPPMFVIFNVVGIASIAAAGHYWLKTGRVFTHWKPVLLCGGCFLLGALLYFFMPLASMSNPPMNWGYARTWEGFIHAFTRGQYEQVTPTTSVVRFVSQVWLYVDGAIDEFGAVYMLVGLIPLFLIMHLRKSERGLIIGLGAVYAFLAFLLLILLNPTPDLQSRELNRVFFTSSHVVIAIGIGFGLSMIAAFLKTQYQMSRQLALWCGAVCAGIALFYMLRWYERTQFPLVRLGSFMGLILPVIFTAMLLMCREKAPLKALLAVFVFIPAQSILLHWSDNEERGHQFGYWFGHDMFYPPFEDGEGQPLYPEMAKDAILFGGTDPGRFNPTYLIFAESFIDPEDRIDPNFDRRDVYLITQNALADATYLSYIRAHYNRSTQVDPPFFQSMLNPPQNVALGRTNLLARMAAPLDRYFTRLGDRIEKDRRAGSSFFKASDFKQLEAVIDRLMQTGDPVADYLKTKLQSKTLAQLQSRDVAALSKSLAKDFNVILEHGPIFDQNRFAEVTLSDRTKRFAAQNPQGHSQIRLNRILLEEFFGEAIEMSLGGVYPDLEIITPSELDSTRAFEGYLADAQRRLAANELKPGEDVRIVGDNVQVAGQVAVMAINALLTKIIFDRNPDHEFYVEESFPLEWMYPHLTPFSVIMKLNREPIEEMSEAIVAKDHQFWRKYSTRLIGDWITYETPVSEVCQFAEQVYILRDYTGFTGDRKFVRDGNAQKAFSKLRSSIGGLYSWRINNSRDDAERERMVREAEFALKQSFAFCPYSPEALFRYTQLLMSLGRMSDALLIAETTLKFDDENISYVALVEQLRLMVQQQSGGMPTPLGPGGVSGATGQVSPSSGTSTNPLQLAFTAASLNLANGNTNGAIEILDKLIEDPEADATTLLSVANAYQQLSLGDRLEKTFYKIVELMPDNPEAFYDLAGIQAIMGKTEDSIQNLARCLALSDQRLQTNSAANNLRQQAASDGRFDALRALPIYQDLMKTP